MCGAQTRPIDRIYVFGDSYSDNGAGYVDGNGPTAVVYLAEKLGCPLVPSTKATEPSQCLNFAVSAAQTGSGEGRHIKDALLGLGIRNQVDDFVQRVRAGSVKFEPESTLFFIAGGLNDGRLQTETTVQNLEGEIRTLYEAGARRFALAVLPTSIPGFRAVATRLNPAIESIPKELAGELPRASISVSHWGTFFDDVMREPAKYGITNTKDRCAGRALFNEDATPCANPDAYYYYHAEHPSTAVHKAVGTKLYDEVRKLPGAGR